MAKRVTQMGDDGKIHTYKNTRARRKSEEREIPWTKAPGKVAQALWH
jgi:hypothetical protein